MWVYVSGNKIRTEKKVNIWVIFIVFFGICVGRRNQYFYLATLMCFLTEEIEESNDNIIIIQFVKT